MWREPADDDRKFQVNCWVHHSDGESAGHVQSRCYSHVLHLSSAGTRGSPLISARLLPSLSNCNTKYTHRAQKPKFVSSTSQPLILGWSPHHSHACPLVLTYRNVTRTAQERSFLEPFARQQPTPCSMASILYSISTARTWASRTTTQPPKSGK